ncbi:ephrin-B2a-like isoform X2 [Scophthalmus maximus]|uniref:ephrin-B2a-like isoform X2 n=1 Tax=Scophthalmus maximus TaxID=52904 RepID=UPI0015E0ADE4|nr:ephrin-B2a-like isoform X2 [Scophthalmus maximus]
MGRRAWSCGAAVLLAVACRCGAATLDSVRWSGSDAKFTAGQGLVLYPQIGDKMDIVCPRADAPAGGKEEFFKVYLVSRSQIESCKIDKTDTPLLNCDKPYRDVKFTFKFQEFSPNLWGLEFLKGRDYYITSTSTGALHGLDNTNGGVCRTKSMKLVLRVGQNAGSDTGQTRPGGSGDSETRLFIWVSSGCAAVSLAVVVLLALLWRHRRGHCVPESQPSASVSLNTLAVPKRDSISSDNNGSDRSDVVFPLRPSDSMICRHYERVSGDYGPPVYIVQEITPQSPTHVYYKV